MARTSRRTDGEEAEQVIYVCHPFAADPMGNHTRIASICGQLVEAGLVPLAPQLMLPAFVSEVTQREVALRLCLRLVALADEVWVFGEVSDGMRLEIAEAERRRVRVRFVEDVAREEKGERRSA